ncbi:MAG: glycosyl transferase [uncultured bacterium]|nr:MAG: glycosyl transferase [uncultured bacterium]
MIVAAVIPAHNESKHIRKVIDKARQYVDYVIVVDDGSNDDTNVIAKSFGGNVVALRHTINLGKGATLKTGCEAASRLKVDAIVCMDADNQHKPESIPQFIKALQEKKVDIVYGMRQFNNKMPFMMLVGNYTLSKVISWLFHVVIHDTQSGYRAFTREAFNKLSWESSGYEAETEMIVRASEQKLKYAEIDIETIYNDNYKGTTALDGVRILLYILRWKFI